MTLYIFFMVTIVMVGWYLYGDNITLTQKTVCMLGAAIFLVGLMTLRFQIGFDYTSYEKIFSTVTDLGWQAVREQYKLEQGFYLFVKAMTEAGLSYRQFLLICNLVMVLCVLLTIYRHSSLWWMSCALYMALQIVPYSMNLLRQALAASLIFATWGFIKRGWLIPYALVVLLAGTIHYSAFIMLPFYFILRLPSHPFVFAGFSAVTFFCYTYLKEIVVTVVGYLPDKYSGYLGHEIYANANSFSAVYFPLILCVVAMLFYKKLVARKKSNKFLINSAFFSFAFTLMITKMFIIERLAIYFFIFSLLLIPEIVMVCKAPYAALDEEQKKERLSLAVLKKKGPPAYFVALVAVLVICMQYFFWNAETGAHKVYPYVGIWEPENAVSNQDYFEDHL